MSMEELKYFFSYSRKDSEFVLQLAKDLRAAGANVWLDQLDILGGEHWDDTIEKTLKSCKGVIAVLSPESVASSNVMDEVSYALDKGKLVVPVIIRSCEIPLRLRRLQHIDFAADYDTGFSQLLRALGIEQPVQTLESAATPEPVFHESTAPLEAKPTELPVHEEQAAQDVQEPSPPEATEPIPDEVDHPKTMSLETEKVEEPLLPEVSEPIPDEINHQKPTGVETRKGGSKRQKTIVLAAICIVALIVIVSIIVLIKNLQAKAYSLDMPDAVGGYVKKDPNQASYNNGETVTLEAVADAKYTFTGWSGDLSDSNNPVKLVMDSDKSVTAHFVKTYSLTATADPNGSISPSGEVTVNSGVNQSFTIKPKTGYQIADVVVDGASIGAVASHTFTKVTADHTIDASFTVAVPPVATYTITALADGGGEINPSGKVTVKSGVDQSFTITPDAGYQIADVVVDGASIGAVASHTFTKVTANHTIDASFTVAVPPVAAYTITALADGGGEISPSGKVTVNSGVDQSFSITPGAGYQITDVAVDDNSVGAVASHTFTNVTANHTIAARFAVAVYTITASTDSGGAISPSGEVLVNSGVDQFFSIKPEDDYKIANVVVDGNSVGAVASHTFTNVTADHTIAAGFALKAVDVVINSIGMKLVYIPAGSFMMGSSSSAAQLAREYNRPEGQFTDEFPQHQVRITEGFWMGQTEVTQGQYKSVMDGPPWSWSGKNYVEEDANNPVVYVLWKDANDFCNKLSQQEGKTYRLPTEAEWEYACRAGTTTRFSFIESDSSLGSHAWFWKNTYEVGQDYAHSVGQEKANSLDLYDMHGNVWEWCSDWYAEDYYSSSTSVDPKGPSSGVTRSLRGGSWVNTEAYLRCSCRDGYNPNVGRSSVGFRVVREQ